MLRKLFSASSELELDDKNHRIIGAARRAHKRALRRDYLNLYFRKNAGLLLPSFVGSLLVLGTIISRGQFAPLVLVVFLANLALHVVFLYLMKSPTRRGRLLMDKLEGFELYLAVAEKDDLDLRHPPSQRSPPAECAETGRPRGKANPQVHQ